jgi:hypothetical protein
MNGEEGERQGEGERERERESALKYIKDGKS